MVSLAEKGRPAPHLYGGRKLVLFIPGSPQCRRGVESFLDMVVCSRTLWEGMRTGQPSTVTSLGLSDLFLEKRKEGEEYIRASWRGEVVLPLGSKAAVLRSASELHIASRSLKPYKLTRSTLI